MDHNDETAEIRKLFDDAYPFLLLRVRTLGNFSYRMPAYYHDDTRTLLEFMIRARMEIEDGRSANNP